MIQKVHNIINNNFMKVDILNGVRRIQRIFDEKSIECFPVFEYDSLVGIVTKKELVSAHPNRIAADIMSNKYKCVSSDEFIWKSKEKFDLSDDIDNIFVVENDVIIGYITRDIINLEVAKHIDTLTGLYKSQYLFYNTYNMITNEQNVTIIFIDLNNFGSIDKMYGHINGDLILKNIANILRENIPADSYLCRYAGDEFAILTTYDINECKVLAEKLLKKIKEFKYPNNIPVSASIGIAVRKMQQCTDENIYHVISNIINAASLASTKAKKRNDNTFIIENEEVNAIA